MGAILVTMHGGVLLAAIALLWWRDNGTHWSLRRRHGNGNGHGGLKQRLQEACKK
jgi:lipopolysaccharide export system permease protein